MELRILILYFRIRGEQLISVLQYYTKLSLKMNVYRKLMLRHAKQNILHNFKQFPAIIFEAKI